MEEKRLQGMSTSNDSKFGNTSFVSSPDRYSHGDILAYVKENDATLNFPQKLMLMLSHADKENSAGGHIDCISWVHKGHAFSIRDRAELVDNLLPLFFREGKFSSFTRKLYRWGFRQICTSKGISKKSKDLVFGHEYFQRDNKTLLSNMRSVTAAGTRRAILALATRKKAREESSRSKGAATRADQPKSGVSNTKPSADPQERQHRTQYATVQSSVLSPHMNISSTTKIPLPGNSSSLSSKPQQGFLFGLHSHSTLEQLKVHLQSSNRMQPKPANSSVSGGSQLASQLTAPSGPRPLLPKKAGSRGVKRSSTIEHLKAALQKRTRIQLPATTSLDAVLRAKSQSSTPPQTQESLLSLSNYAINGQMQYLRMIAQSSRSLSANQSRTSNGSFPYGNKSPMSSLQQITSFRSNVESQAKIAASKLVSEARLRELMSPRSHGSQVPTTIPPNLVLNDTNLLRNSNLLHQVGSKRISGLPSLILPADGSSFRPSSTR